ncbi:MAG: hypothetical protein H7838_10210, partial [Magnetococcus sp. DMHC-8]
HAKTQCAGRVNRHRLLPVTEPNVYLLPTSLRAIRGSEPGGFHYCRPGPEGNVAALRQSYRLPSPWVADLLAPATVAVIDAQPHLLPGLGGHMAALEHRKIAEHLSDPHAPCSLRGFWTPAVKAWLSGAHAHRMPFRQSTGSLDVWLHPDQDQFFETNRGGRDIARGETIVMHPQHTLGVHRLLDLTPATIWEEEQRKHPEWANDEHKKRSFCQRYLQVSIPIYGDSLPSRIYSPDFGVHPPLE